MGRKTVYTADKVAERVKKVWGDTIILDKTTYINMSTKCRFICKKHGEFWARIDTVLSGHSCNLCGHEKQKVCLTDSLEEAQAKLDKKSNNTLVIVKNTFVNSRTKCHIICKNCSYDYFVKPTQAYKCPMCTKYSIEKEILNILMKKGINYIHDKALKGCHYKESKRCLRPDFYIETEKGILWLECDGANHFLSIHGEEELKEIQARDEFKNNYCKNNNICLIRIKTTNKWGTNKHLLLENAVKILDEAINQETKEINFEFLKQYNFNK